MNVLFFGTGTLVPGYPVNRFLLTALRQAGAHVEECHETLWTGRLHEVYARARPWTLAMQAVRALPRYVQLAWRYRAAGPCDWIIVGYPGYVDMIWARLLGLRRRRPIALVAFISLYDTVVADREQASAGSWRARLLRWVDRRAFDAADVVLVDTLAQARHYAQVFKLPRTRFQRSFVGHEFCDMMPASAGSTGTGAPNQPVAEQPTAGAASGAASGMTPPGSKVTTAGDAVGSSTTPGPLQVLFFGTYVPLHGVDVILRAAHRLREEQGVRFRLIGAGQLLTDMRRLAAQLELKNVEFRTDWMDAAQLRRQVLAADVCLGIFGVTAKAARVIPYKVLGALALARPVVSRDGPAIRELLSDGESAILCAPGDPAALAGALLRLRDDAHLATRLAAEGHRAYVEQAAPATVGRALLRTLQEVDRERCRGSRRCDTAGSERR